MQRINTILRSLIAAARQFDATSPKSGDPSRVRQSPTEGDPPALVSPPTRLAPQVEKPAHATGSGGRSGGSLSSIFGRKRLAICLLIIILSAIVFHVSLWHYSTNQIGKEEDIYYLWLEGKRLLAAQNPYERVMSGNLRNNQKYATYFPLFYIFSCFTQLFGLRDYSSWLFFWRHIFLLFNLGIASVIFYVFYQKKFMPIAIFFTLFWLFNRWTLYVTKVAQIDFMPILFLILSLLTFRRHKWWSLILYSVSLALKQIAIFLAPLYLICVWQSENRHRVRKIFIALALILSIPLLTSLPFIFWNAEGYFKSIIFSATRKAGSQFDAPSFDAYISFLLPGFIGIKAKLPMLFLMSLIYFTAFQRNLGLYMSSLLIMLIFIDFNSVLFIQYMCWIVPLIALAVCDSMKIHQ